MQSSGERKAMTPDQIEKCQILLEEIHKEMVTRKNIPGTVPNHPLLMAMYDVLQMIHPFPEPGGPGVVVQSACFFGTELHRNIRANYELLNSLQCVTKKGKEQSND